MGDDSAQRPEPGSILETCLWGVVAWLELLQISWHTLDTFKQKMCEGLLPVVWGPKPTPGDARRGMRREHAAASQPRWRRQGDGGMRRGPLAAWPVYVGWRSVARLLQWVGWKLTQLPSTSLSTSARAGAHYPSPYPSKYPRAHRASHRHLVSAGRAVSSRRAPSISCLLPSLVAPCNFLPDVPAVGHMSLSWGLFLFPCMNSFDEPLLCSHSAQRHEASEQRRWWQRQCLWVWLCKGRGWSFQCGVCLLLWANSESGCERTN